MKLLVTGAFGYVGARVARTLASLGHEVVLAGRRVPPWAADAFRGHALREVDVLDARALSDAVRDVASVVHLASLNERESASDAALALRVREEGTRMLMAAAADAAVRRVVFFSTYHVYAPGSGPVIDERSPLGPATPYGVAHLAGERACISGARGAASAVVLRISNVYGRPLHHEIDRWTLAHNDLCRQAVRERRIAVRAPGVRRDLVWVEDVAQATDIVLRADAAALADPVLNVGGDRVTTVGDLATLVGARAELLLGSPVDLDIPRTVDVDPPFTYSSARLSAHGFRPRDALVEETDALISMLRLRLPSGP